MAGGVGFSVVGLMIPALIVDTGYVTDYQARTLSFLLSGATFLVDPWINSFAGQLLLSAGCTATLGVSFTLSMALVVKVNVGNIAQVVSFSVFMSGKYARGVW